MPALGGGFEFGSDGVEYFDVLGVAEPLLVVYDLLEQARTVYDELAAITTDPAAKLDAAAQASVCDLIVAELSRGADEVARLTAKEAQAIAVAELHHTQVRPDPPGVPYGVRLAGNIICRAVSGFVGTLEVGIGDVERLDSVVGHDGGTYWRAQEFGSSHLVGHRVRGLFMPGAHEASSSRDRLESTIELGGSHRILIRNPIEARHFLSTAAIEARAFREREFRPIEGHAVSEMKLVQSGNHPRLGAVRGASRRI